MLTRRTSVIGFAIACALSLWAGTAVADDPVDGAKQDQAKPPVTPPPTPTLQHQIIERAAPGHVLRVTATTPQCSDCRLVLYVRSQGRSFFARISMKRIGAVHTGIVSADAMRGTSLHYYIEIRDGSGKHAGSGRTDSPHIVDLDPSVKPPPAIVKKPQPANKKRKPANKKVLVAMTKAPPAPAIRGESRRSSTHCEVGPQVSYIRYNEPDIMTESGMMMGLAGSCSTGRTLVFSIEGRYSVGWIDYDGRLMTGEPYTVANNFNTLFEGRALFSRTIGRSANTDLISYLGFGYRALFDGLGQDSRGYDRRSKYYYSPFGVRFDRQVGADRLVLNAEYRYFWKGRQRSNLSDLDASLPDVTNKQRKGYGLSTSVRFSHKRPTWKFEVEPYVRYWSIGQSDPVVLGTNANGQPVGLVEPKNTSAEIGVNLAARF